jgi:hypothetical protein
VVKLMGVTLREETVTKIERALFDMTHGVVNSKKPIPKFKTEQNPDHWVLALEGHYCDHLGRSMMFLTIIEALEAEDWKLKGSNSILHPESGKEINKFFFVRDQ